MNEQELNRLLRSAREPEASSEFRNELAQRVTIAIHQRKRRREPAALEPRGFNLRRWALGSIAFATVILVGMLAVSSRTASKSANAIVRAEKYFREIELLFPHQVRAVVLGAEGPRMVLSETGDVPDSPAVYLKICGPRGCQEVVTFSGQQVQVNGETCDVLLDSSGDVLLVGHELVWSSNASAKSAGNYRIQAQTLGKTS